MVRRHTAKDNPLIAKTEIHWCWLKQERLHNITIYPYETNADAISAEHQNLYKIALHNRLQVGKSKDGTWKIFDYEDIKYYLNRRKNESIYSCLRILR